MISSFTPSPDAYKPLDPKKYKESNSKIALPKAELKRTELIKKTDEKDFVNHMQAFKAAAIEKPKVYSTAREKKTSFVDAEIKKRSKNPSPSSYNTDKAYKIISGPPAGAMNSRRR